MRIVPVVAQKGVLERPPRDELAAICAEAAPVLMLDIDPQGSATWWADNAGARLPFDFTPKPTSARWPGCGR